MLEEIVEQLLACADELTKALEPYDDLFMALDLRPVNQASLSEKMRRAKLIITIAKGEKA